MNRTELRHQMLTAIRDLKVSFELEPLNDRDWKFDVYASTYVQMARAANWCDEHDLIESGPLYVQVTDRGERLLAEWDEKYGPVTG